MIKSISGFCRALSRGSLLARLRGAGVFSCSVSGTPLGCRGAYKFVFHRQGLADYALFMLGMVVFCFSNAAWAGDKELVREVGVAKIDITPDFPVRLNGYYGRNIEATNAAQHIFAKALAIGSDKEGPAIFVTIDNCIVPRIVREQVVECLLKKAHIEPTRVALCVSHTHTAPCLTGAAPNLFGMDIPAADQAHIDRYTRELIDKVEKVSLAALKDRRPATLAWGQDKATLPPIAAPKAVPWIMICPFWS